jgi:hypothetical protein
MHAGHSSGAPGPQQQPIDFPECLPPQASVQNQSSDFPVSDHRNALSRHHENECPTRKGTLAPTISELRSTSFGSDKRTSRSQVHEKDVGSRARVGCSTFPIAYRKDRDISRRESLWKPRGCNGLVWHNRHLCSAGPSIAL